MNLWPYLPLGAIGNPVSDRAWAIFLGCFLAAVALGLLVLSWTRWGQSKLLTKCIAIAFLAHIWLLLYAYGTRIPYGNPADGTGSQGTQLALVESKTSVSVAWTPQDSTAAPHDDESWSDPPSLQNADTIGDPSADPRTDSDSHSTPLWNRSLESQRAPDFALLGDGKSAKLGWHMQDYNLHGAAGNAAAATAIKGQALLDAVGVQLAKLIQEITRFEPLI